MPAHGISTRPLWPTASDPGALVDRALALGAAGLVPDATLPRGLADALMRVLAARRDDLCVPAVEHPLPGPPPGKRAPRLASEDREERRAALATLTATLAEAARLGAPTVVVRLGSLDVKHGWEATARASARRELTVPEVERIEALRTELSARALDLARFGLDGAVAAAGAAGVSLALVNRARWFEIPDEPELGVLLADFRGAPLTTWLDPAAAHVKEALGHRDRLGALLAAHAAGGAGVWLVDACGLRGALPWRRGEVDAALVEGALPAAALRIVHGGPGATDAELAAALT